MDTSNLQSLAPLAALAATAVAAMLLAPLAAPRTVRTAAAAGTLLAVALMLWRWSAPAAPATDLLADDPLGRLGALLVALAGLAVVAIVRIDRGAREGPALAVLATAGLVTLCAALDGTTVFLGLEIASLSLVVLFAFALDGKGVEAGYKYFLMAGAAAAALLLGIAVVFAATGSLALAALGSGGALVAAGTALVLSAVAFKFSLVPFHAWTPDVFEASPAGAAALAGVASKIAVVVLVLRLDAAGMPEPAWSLALGVAAAASILLGNLVALRQTSLKRMLGWSSVAHTGYLAAIVASGADIAGEAALFYLFAYAPALLAALAAAATLPGEPDVAALEGLAQRSPLAGTGLALALVSLSGLPPAAGFVGKVYLFTALAGAGAWGLLAAAAAGSALGFFYYFRFVVALFRAPPEAAPAATGPSPAEAAVLAGTALSILVLGIYPGPFMMLARTAAG